MDGFTAALCALYSGYYQGPFTSCQPDPCPPAAGACCDPATTACTITPEGGCPGIWKGFGTTCTPNPCASGACCATDGTCALTTRESCPSPGLWQGGGTVCDPNPCIGACCFGAGCIDGVTGPECDLYNGSFQGRFTTFNPNPCPTSSARDGSAVSATLQLWAVPNPSPGPTLLRYGLPRMSLVNLQVLNAAGSLVRSYPRGVEAAGFHSVLWDAKNETGRNLATGVYWFRLSTSSGTRTEKIILTR